MIAGRVWDGRLTPGQGTVCELLAKGFTCSEVATHVGVSTATVYLHRKEAYRALGLRNDVELVRFAIAHGLIESPTPDTCVPDLIALRAMHGVPETTPETPTTEPT